MASIPLQSKGVERRKQFGLRAIAAYSDYFD